MNTTDQPVPTPPDWAMNAAKQLTPNCAQRPPFERLEPIIYKRQIVHAAAIITRHAPCDPFTPHADHSKLVQRLRDVRTQLLDDALSVRYPLATQMYYRKLAEAITDAIAALERTPDHADERDDLMKLLERARVTIEVAFNTEADGDVFGIHHNQATDDLSAIEEVLARHKPLSP